MLGYRCPLCKERVEHQALSDGGRLFRCRKCGMGYLSRNEDEDEAYLELLEAHDKGELAIGGLEELLIKEGYLRDEAEIDYMIRKNGLDPERLSDEVRALLKGGSDYVVDYRVREAEPIERGGDPSSLGLHEALVVALRAEGIDRLYRFQEEAVERILKGEDVVICAPTGTGKTEAFALPILHLLAQERSGALLGGGLGLRGLIVYPTKALARDQLPKLKRLAQGVGIGIRIFDGDTPSDERRSIVEKPPELIITNFDTLHQHMMHKTPFSRLLRGLRFLVVDEVHVYTGTFGSNVHFIVKRLERLAGTFQIIASSATVQNPSEFCGTLFGRSFSLISCSGGSRSRLHLITLYPTLRSHRSLVLDLLKRLSRGGRRVLAFSRSHLGAELTAYYAKKAGLAIEVHRAGLLPSHRERVEREFKAGRLKALACTPTLELGIDIGHVDGIVSDLVNLTRLTQRIGRAGRRGQESIAILALREDDPISQYYRQHPEEYYSDLEPTYTDPNNPAIAKVQLLAAAMDSPILDEEFKEYREFLSELEEEGLLVRKGRKLHPRYSLVRRILAQHDIRGSGHMVEIRSGGKKIGERSLPKALEELHPGAIYFHGGVRYRSEGLKLEGLGGVAELTRLSPSYPFYTRAIKEEEPSILRVHQRRKVLGLEVLYADLKILKRIVGYRNIDMATHRPRGGVVMLEEPIEYEFRTKGIVFRAPRPLEHLSKPDEATEEAEGSCYHATEHVLIEGTNMITGGAAQDMGGISLGATGLIFIHDASVGGNGASLLLYHRLEEALRRAHALVRECSCDRPNGCPRCIQSYDCGNDNRFLSKPGALEVLSRILAGEGREMGEVA